jgi:hypothetical protein
MAIIFTEGFESTNAPNGVIERPTATWNNTPGSGLTAGRINGSAHTIGGTSGGDLNGNWSFSLPSTYSEGFFGDSIIISGTPVSSRRFMLVRNGSTTHLSVYLNTDRSLSVARDTTILATSAPGVIVPTAWHRVELGFVISDTVGSYELRVDGATVLSATGVDTQNGVTTGVNVLIVANQQNVTITHDDITFNDTTGPAPNNTFLGDLHIEQLVPTSDSSIAWTRSTGASNFSCVDEARISTTDYITIAAPGTDRYGLKDVTNTPAQIFGVNVSFHGNKDNTGACDIRANLVSGGTVGTGTTRSMNTAAMLYTELFETDPDTGSAWTGAAVNNLMTEVERVT